MRILPKIKYVKEPIQNVPKCRGGYCSKSKTILIRKYTEKKYINSIILHEFGHYLIDVCLFFPFLKHYTNLLWELLSVLLDKDKDIKKCIIWYIDYYKNARKKGTWVY